MANQQLLDYIKQQLEQGASTEQIKNAIIARGWKESDMNEAFAALSQDSTSSSLTEPPAPSPEGGSLPKATAMLGEAWSLYKPRMGTFLGITIMPGVVLAGLFIVLASGGLVLGPVLFSPKLTALGVGLLILFAILFVVVVLISQMWGQTALLSAIKDSRETIGIKDAYRRSWSKILSYWWVSLLASFVTVGGFLLFLIPGIIFAVWFSLALFVFISEDVQGMNALLKSREYVKGRWWSIFWRFLFIGLLFLIVSMIPLLIFSVLKIPYLGEISRFAIGLFLTPLIMIYAFLVYGHLKKIKGELVFAPTKKQKAAFITVGILGFLIIPAILFSMIFLGSGSHSAREKAHDAQRESDIRQIQTGLDMYYSEHESYPLSLEELSPEYLPAIPLDPETDAPYSYQRTSDAEYEVCAQMETKAPKCISSQL